MNKREMTYCIFIFVAGLILTCGCSRSTPQVDYSKQTPQFLLNEARQLGLNPSVDTSEALVIRQSPESEDLVRALYRNEDAIVSLIDPDAGSARRIKGAWRSIKCERGTGACDSSFFTIHFNPDHTFQLDGDGTGAFPSIVFSISGSMYGKWNINNQIIKMKMSHMDNPIGNLTIGILNQQLGIVNLSSETMIIEEQLERSNGKVDIIRRWTYQRLK